MGRHPAAVGVLAHGAQRARLSDRPSGDARRPRRPRRRSSSRSGDQRRLEACQSPVWDTALAIDRARRRRRGARRPGPRARGATGCSAEEIRVPRRLGRAPPRARARRLGLRVRQRQLPRHRRHGRGGARAAPRRRTRDAERRRAARSGAASTGSIGMQSARRRLGRVRRRQHPRRCASSCRSATSARSSTRRAPTSPRTSSRCSPLEGRASEPAAAARASRWLLDAQEADGSWFGRWGVNHVYGTGRRRARARRRPACPRGDPAIRRAVALARATTRTPTAAGARTRAPTTTRRGSGAATSTASQTAWALLALEAAGERVGGGRRAAWLAGRHPAPRRRLGRAAVHRHRLPGRLLHQLPPVPAGVPGHGAGPLPAAR